VLADHHRHLALRQGWLIKSLLLSLFRRNQLRSRPTYSAITNGVVAVSATPNRFNGRAYFEIKTALAGAASRFLL
jgi:hypothetical protein